MSDVRVQHSNWSSRIGTTIVVHRVRGARRGAVVGRARQPAAARRNLRLCRAGEPVESAGRLRRARLGRPAGLRRIRRLHSVRARHAGGRSSARRHSAGGRRRRHHRGAGRRPDLPPARALFRHRHLGGGGGVPPARGADLGARRRLRHEPAGRGRHLDRVEPADARVRRSTGSRSLRSPSSCSPSSGCCARATGWRSPRSATTSSARARTASTSRASNIAVYVAVGVRHRHGRRADIPAEDPHLARHRVFASTTGPPSSSSSP